MRKSRFSEVRIAEILKEGESGLLINAPISITVDHGTEFTSKALDD